MLEKLLVRQSCEIYTGDVKKTDANSTDIVKGTEVQKSKRLVPLIETQRTCGSTRPQEKSFGARVAPSRKTVEDFENVSSPGSNAEFSGKGKTKSSMSEEKRKAFENLAHVEVNRTIYEIDPNAHIT